MFLYSNSILTLDYVYEYKYMYSLFCLVREQEVHVHVKGTHHEKMATQDPEGVPLAPRMLHSHFFFLEGFLHISLDGLSERGTTLGLFDIISTITKKEHSNMDSIYRLINYHKFHQLMDAAC